MKKEALYEIIDLINDIKTGKLETIVRNLQLIKRELFKIDQPELARQVSEAIKDLELGNTRNFRKKLSNVSSKLGHIKA